MGKDDTSFVALVLGASGLTGSALLNELIGSPNCSQIHILVRRPVDSTSPKLVTHVVDFSNKQELEACIPEKAVLFSCLGTTMRHVKGDKTAYRKIDFDIPLTVAGMVKAKGGKEMVLLSSIGANARSGNFYLALKGEIEEAFIKLQPEQLHIYRPSVLVGNRKEKRMGEGLGKILLQALSFLLIGKWSNYHPAPVEKIAHSMVDAIGKKDTPVQYYYWKDFSGLL